MLRKELYGANLHEPCDLLGCDGIGKMCFFQRPHDPIPMEPPEADFKVQKYWHIPVWCELRNYTNLRENKDPTKPILFGYLTSNKLRDKKAQLLGRRPKPIGSYYLYICRACDRLFQSRQPPWITKRPDCGCVQRQIGKSTQTLRLEGKQYGWLIVSEYALADGKGNRGGWKCICLGIDGKCQRECIVHTSRLMNLRTLACEECSPEDWSGQRGGRALWSVHTRILEEHRKREKEQNSNLEQMA